MDVLLGVGVTEEEVGDEVRWKQVIHCANP